jgi:hypothetical protein
VIAQKKKLIIIIIIIMERATGVGNMELSLWIPSDGHMGQRVESH